MLVSSVQQNESSVYIYIYPFPFGLPSHSNHHTALSRVHYMWNLEKMYKQSYLQSRNKDTDIENKCVDTTGEGVVRGIGTDTYALSILSMDGASGKEPTCQYRRHKRYEFDAWVRSSPGEGNGYPPQYICLRNPMDREAWQAIIHRLQRVRHDWSNLAQYSTCEIDN